MFCSSFLQKKYTSLRWNDKWYLWMKLITIRNCWNCKGMLSKDSRFPIINFNQRTWGRDKLSVQKHGDLSNVQPRPESSTFRFFAFGVFLPLAPWHWKLPQKKTLHQVWSLGEGHGFGWNSSWRVCNLLCVIKEKTLKGTSCLKEIYIILLKRKANNWRLEPISYFIPNETPTTTNHVYGQGFRVWAYENTPIRSHTNRLTGSPTIDSAVTKTARETYET